MSRQKVAVIWVSVVALMYFAHLVQRLGPHYSSWWAWWGVSGVSLAVIAWEAQRLEREDTAKSLWIPWGILCGTMMAHLLDATGIWPMPH